MVILCLCIIALGVGGGLYCNTAGGKGTTPCKPLLGVPQGVLFGGVAVLFVMLLCGTELRGGMGVMGGGGYRGGGGYY